MPQQTIVNGIVLEQHFPLVRHVLKRYRHLATPGLDLEDMFAEGVLGLQRAAKRYDPAKGMWSTYAVTAIRRAICRALDDSSRAVRVPVWALAARYERGEYTPAASSLDTPVHVDGNASRLDLLEDTDQIDPLTQAADAQAAQRVRALVAELPSRLRTIVCRRFGLEGEHEGTLDQIGDDFGLTRERIRQLEAIALDRLRRSGLQR